MDSRQFRTIVLEFGMTRVFDAINILRIKPCVHFSSELFLMFECPKCRVSIQSNNQLYISPIFITIKTFPASIAESTNTRIGSRVKRQVYESIRKIPKQAKQRISQSVRMIKIESYDKRDSSQAPTTSKYTHHTKQIERIVIRKRKILILNAFVLIGCCHIDFYLIIQYSNIFNSIERICYGDDDAARVCVPNMEFQFCSIPFHTINENTECRIFFGSILHISFLLCLCSVFNMYIHTNRMIHSSQELVAKTS